jgi:hypothetical protein
MTWTPYTDDIRYAVYGNKMTSILLTKFWLNDNTNVKISVTPLASYYDHKIHFPSQLILKKDASMQFRFTSHEVMSKICFAFLGYDSFEPTPGVACLSIQGSPLALSTVTRDPPLKDPQEELHS